MIGYITKLNDSVERDHVRFKNRYGLYVAGDLYYSKKTNLNKKYPAIVVGAPYGGVKEQGPCVYANELAQRTGFEPADAFTSHDFQSCSFDRSDISAC